MLAIYFVVLFLFSIYSYSLVDPNLTLLTHPLWARFRDYMVQLGYYQRDISSYFFLIFILFLFLFQYLFTKKEKTKNPMAIAVVVAVALFISYPFLSHDFFNYIFDAKIVTYYQSNPYLHIALDFPQDPWLRFMHWTHRTYPYGPTFLLITLIPSFLAFGKFILNFFLFKTLFISFYLAGVYFLNKLGKRYAFFFATSPLVIVEGIVNAHNDLIAVTFGLIGVYFILQSKRIGYLFALLSGGVKYITTPAILLTRSNKKLNILAFILILSIIAYLSVFVEVQPWYFLNLLLFLPIFWSFVSRLHLFFFGLLLSYYPYIRYGGWSDSSNIQLKHTIILVFLIANAILIVKDLGYNRKK